MIRLAVRVPRAAAEIVLAELLELVPGGLEETDVSEGVVEYALYGAAGELPDLPALRAAAGDVVVDVSSSEVPDDWADRWKAWHRPVDVAWRFRRLRVRPPWEEALAGGSGIDLVIDPGQAFGTGAHHTTRLCLELLLELEPGGGLADLGCGSGVVAIAAARMGWEPVFGLDFDQRAVDATRSNARRNGVAVRAVLADLREIPPPPARTLVANMPLEVHERVATAVSPATQEVIASGLTASQEEAATAAYAQSGLFATGRRVAGGWTTLRLGRP